MKQLKYKPSSTQLHQYFKAAYREHIFPNHSSYLSPNILATLSVCFMQIQEFPKKNKKDNNSDPLFRLLTYIKIHRHLYGDYNT